MALDIAFARRAITTPAAITSASPIPVRGYVLLMPSRDKKGSRSSMTRHPLTRPSYESSLPTCIPSTVTEVSFSSRLLHRGGGVALVEIVGRLLNLEIISEGGIFLSPLPSKIGIAALKSRRRQWAESWAWARFACRLFSPNAGWRREKVNLGDLFSKEGVKEQRSPFHGWAIRHARNNFNSRNAEQYLSLNNRGPRYSASRVYSEN